MSQLRLAAAVDGPDDSAPPAISDRSSRALGELAILLAEALERERQQRASDQFEILAANRRADSITRHLSYRLGRVLVEGGSSFGGLLAVPYRIWKTVRGHQAFLKSMPALPAPKRTRPVPMPFGEPIVIGVKPQYFRIPVGGKSEIDFVARCFVLAAGAGNRLTIQDRFVDAAGATVPEQRADGERANGNPDFFQTKKPVRSGKSLLVSRTVPPGAAELEVAFLSFDPMLRLVVQVLDRRDVQSVRKKAPAPKVVTAAPYPPSRYDVYTSLARMFRGGEAFGPRQVNGLLGHFKVLNELKDTVGVELLFQRAVGRLGHDRPASESEAELFLAGAAAMIKNGNLAEARALMETVLETAHGRLLAQRQLAALIRYEDLPRAIQLMRAAAAHRGFAASTPAKLLLLDLLVQAGETSEALTLATRFAASSKEPDFAFMRANLVEGEEERMAIVNDYFTRRRLAPLVSSNGRLTMDHVSAPSAAPVLDGPLVSVIMTTYNSAAYVETAIRSILEQSYRNLELWVVDDVSKDGTPEIVERIAATDPRVKLVRQPANGGTYMAKNVALAQCAGDFVTCHDSDDWAHPERTARQVAALLADPGLAGCYSRWVRMTDDGRFPLMAWNRMIYENPASLMIRRELVLREVGVFDSVRVGADTEFRQRIEVVFGAGSVLGIGDVLTLGRIHDASLTRSGAGAIDAQGSSPVRREYAANWLDWHVHAKQKRMPMALGLAGAGRVHAVPAAIDAAPGSAPAAKPLPSRFAFLDAG